MLSWIVAGQEYQLNDFEYAKLLEHESFGLPNIRRLEESGPLQHGVTDYGFRMDARTLILTLGIRGEDMNDYYAKRNKLVDIFKPRQIPGRLRFRQGSVTRDIQGFTLGDSLNFAKGRDHIYQKVAVAIRCPDPTWYDPAIAEIGFSPSISGDIGEIPSLVSMLVGSSVLNSVENITYKGTAETFPTIRITGPVESPVITHLQTGYKLDFTGYTLGSGKWVEVDTSYGHKTVLDQDGANRINELTKDSDLAMFSILPDPEVGGGINTISVVGASVSSSTSISIVYYIRDLGV